MAPLTPAARRPVTVLLVILIGVASFLAVRSELNAREAQAALEQSQRNVVAIQANTDRLENVVHEQCEAGQQFAQGINTVLDTLIAATEANTLLSPAEKASRVVGYQKAKQTVPACAKP
jgi:uncharacterized membrane protein